MEYYPNCKKQSVFEAFAVGKHPSELVKVFKTLKYRTLMVYYEEWKRAARKKQKIIKEFEDRIRINLTNDMEGMKLRGTYKPFIKKFLPSARAYLKNKPYNWFENKNLKGIVEILSKSPWEWEK